MVVSLDIKNSITDPFENIYVKTYNLNNPINLISLCDIFPKFTLAPKSLINQTCCCFIGASQRIFSDGTFLII